LTTNVREEVRHVSVHPFGVSIPRETLDDLRERLRRMRFLDEVSGAS
jgi:hypothetical protein